MKIEEKKMTIKYSTNQEGWRLENYYKELGYKKTSDCYWYQDMTNGDITITLERE